MGRRTKFVAAISHRIRREVDQAMKELIAEISSGRARRKSPKRAEPQQVVQEARPAPLRIVHKRRRAA